ncbi:hypothetical protein, partial [Shouchella clausii]|uniref:hypothetical protein n=1 Tax=Shouchella clausii TaxID=79880 RepID=UPI001C5333E8
PQVQYFYLMERGYGKENHLNNSCYFNFDLDWLKAFQGFLFKLCRPYVRRPRSFAQKKALTTTYLSEASESGRTRIWLVESEEGEDWGEGYG